MIPRVPRAQRVVLAMLLGWAIGQFDISLGSALVLAVCGWLVVEYFCDSFDNHRWW